MVRVLQHLGRDFAVIFKLLPGVRAKGRHSPVIVPVDEARLKVKPPLEENTEKHPLEIEPAAPEHGTRTHPAKARELVQNVGAEAAALPRPRSAHGAAGGAWADKLLPLVYQELRSLAAA